MQAVAMTIVMGTKEDGYSGMDGRGIAGMQALTWGGHLKLGWRNLGGGSLPLLSAQWG